VEQGSGALCRTVTWRSAVVVTVGAGLLVTVSLGPMAAELGRASPFVWLAVALVGALQCALLAELAGLLPDRAGGTATYAHSAFGERAPILGAASSWAYWFAWTPGIAVNLILAATYLREVAWAGLDTLTFALLIGAALYALNALGLRPSMRAAGIAAFAALVPLVVLLAGALLQPGLLQLDRLTPVSVPERSWGETATWLLVAKWAFVAAWAAYGAEMASTVVAEMHDAGERAPRALLLAGGIGVFAFGVLPFLMVALVGTGALAGDPLVAFLPVAEAVLGDAGRTAVGVMLVAALVLGAQAFVVGSSRTIYQMSRDGYLPRQFAHVNRRGAPVGSLVWDVAVIGVLLLVFGSGVVDVVAAANVGYLVVFVLLPAAFVVLHRRHRGDGVRRFRLGRAFVPIAVALGALNALLLVVGAAQWGTKVVLVGGAVMALIVPISALRRLQDRRSGRSELLPFPAGEPHDLGEPVPAPARARAIGA
jgi:amino acid transporter